MNKKVVRLLKEAPSVLLLLAYPYLGGNVTGRVILVSMASAKRQSKFLEQLPPSMFTVKKEDDTP